MAAANWRTALAKSPTKMDSTMAKSKAKVGSSDKPSVGKSSGTKKWEGLKKINLNDRT